MKAKRSSSGLKRRSEVLSQLPEAPLRLNRAIEILLHAYKYVRGVDPDKERNAAGLIWTKYQELKRKQRRQGSAVLTFKEVL
jgi:hypothetical protein